MSDQNNMSNLLITITTLIFAITSIITVYITVTAWREERAAERPYVTFSGSPKVSVGPKLIFSFSFSNVGTHPAANLNSQTIIIDSGLDKKPLYTDQFSLVNYIPHNTTSDLVIKIDLESTALDKKNINEHFIIISLKYDDPIIKKEYEQIIYLKWGGVNNTEIYPIFHASLEEKNNIVKYFLQ